MSGSGERLGILGGTFDPPHIGHLASAVNALSALSLNRVLLVVANRPWQKVGTRQISPAEVRLEMVRNAVRGLRGLEASDCEIVRGGDSTTAETVQEFRAEDPTRELFVILGRDAAAGLLTWRSPETIRDLSTIAVVDREHSSGGQMPPGWSSVEVAMPRLDVSSSDLRQRVRDGRPLDVLVPAAVIEVIVEHHLYGVGR